MWKKKSGERRLEERRRGPRGFRGPAGPAGPQGPRGKTGPKGGVTKLNTLEALDAHVQKIEHELSIQLQRIAQLQRELDEVRSAMKRLGAVPTSQSESRPKERQH